MVYSGICHGTLGEVIQGPFVRNGELHVGIISLPIKKYSWAYFNSGETGDIDADLLYKEKCHRAIDIFLAQHGRSLPAGRWSYDSELLQGKGMASSTADIVATIRCLDAVFGMCSPPALISKILRNIERSDSVFLDTYALYLSDRQEVVHCFPGDPGFYVCYIDEGYTIDTEAVSQTLCHHYEHRLAQYTANLRLAVDAFGKQDLAEIARCATQSATLAQEAIPKRNFDLLRRQQCYFKADGIVVAHTGSILGYLYIEKPCPMALGELSSFFRGLGYQCRFLQTGF